MIQVLTSCQVLTMESSITCPTSGVVTKQSSAKLTVGGKAVLTKASVEKRPIAGCKQTNAGETQCLVASVSAGEATKLSVGANAALLEDTFAGTGSGRPANALSAEAIQTKLGAV